MFFCDRMLIALVSQKERHMNKKILMYVIMLMTFGIMGCKSEGVNTTISSDKTDRIPDTIYENEEDSDYSESKNSSIYVYVCGEVNTPGVYEVSEDARVFEVLNKAGGYTKDAATNLNLAETVYDGEKISVLSKEEYEELSIYNSEELSEVSNDNLPGDALENDGLININNADVNELKSLPGIGEKKAQAIVNYREENGFYKDISDLLNVSGIGDGIYDQIKDCITV